MPIRPRIGTAAVPGFGSGLDEAAVHRAGTRVTHDRASVRPDGTDRAVFQRVTARCWRCCRGRCRRHADTLARHGTHFDKVAGPGCQPRDATRRTGRCKRHPCRPRGAAVGRIAVLVRADQRRPNGQRRRPRDVNGSIIPGRSNGSGRSRGHGLGTHHLGRMGSERHNSGGRRRAGGARADLPINIQSPTHEATIGLQCTSVACSCRHREKSRSRWHVCHATGCTHTAQVVVATTDQSGIGMFQHAREPAAESKTTCTNVGTRYIER